MAQRSLYDLLNGENASGNPSLAEDAANPDAVTAGQRFVDNFTGKSLDTDIWTLHNVAGSGGTAAIDSDGLKLTAGTSSSNNIQIDFNNKRPFSQTGSRVIGNIQKITAENIFIDGGFKNDYGDNNNNLAFLHIEEYSSSDGIFFQTNGAWTNTGKLLDNNWHTFDIEMRSSSGILILDGTISVTRTSDLPAATLQPAFKLLNRLGGTKEGRVRYCEAYNT